MKDLIKAIDNFDITQPVRFSTYGVPMIIGEIRRYLRDNSTIRVSRSMRDTAYKVLQVRERFMAENQREPTVEQIAKGDRKSEVPKGASGQLGQAELDAIRKVLQEG